MIRKEDKPGQIKELRSYINRIDSEIVNLLTERRKLSLKIIKAKNLDRRPVREKERENEIIKRIISIAKRKKLDTFFASRIFYEIIEDSVRLQQRYVQKNEKEVIPGAGIKISLQGIEGSYSYMAAKKYFASSGGNFILNSKNRFDEVVQSVENGESDFAVLPIENTTSGGINEVYDLLFNTTLSIIGEEIYKVEHCLAAIKTIPLKKIKKIFTHYQAAAQCSKFISSLPNSSLEYFHDTAMSFRKLKEDGILFNAAIAGEAAAKIYGLKILKTNIANQTDNYTRFLIASRKPAVVDEKKKCKTSIVIVVSNKTGSLVNALSPFKRNKINLTRLESRPVLGNPWDEMFFVDFEGNIAKQRIQRVLKQVSEKTSFMKILGCYNMSNFTKTGKD